MADSGLLESLLRLVEKVDGGLDSQDAVRELGVEHQVVVGAVKSLQALGEVIEATQRSSKHWELTGEGREISEQGSHEARVFNAIPEEGLPQSQLMKLPSGKVGFSKAMSNKWIRLDKAHEGGPCVFRTYEQRLHAMLKSQCFKKKKKKKKYHEHMVSRG
uniref:Phenylalanine--tRNA ligase alpha subunit n=1 Tax=Astyanax mexicanus TaxID=7994 RepID=A0A8B9H5Y1_ASTMX